MSEGIKTFWGHGPRWNRFWEDYLEVWELLRQTSFKSRPGKPKERKGQNDKFMNFAHYCELWCFYLRQQAQFTLNFCSGMPVKSSWTDLSLVWFAGVTPDFLVWKNFRAEIPRPRQLLTLSGKLWSATGVIWALRAAGIGPQSRKKNRKWVPGASRPWGSEKSKMESQTSQKQLFCNYNFDSFSSRFGPFQTPKACKGFIRHRPPRPHPRIRLALPSSGVDLASI